MDTASQNHLNQAIWLKILKRHGMACPVCPEIMLTNIVYYFQVPWYRLCRVVFPRSAGTAADDA